MSLLSLDHVCFEVEDIEAAESMFKNILGFRSEGISTIDLGKGNGFVKTVFFHLERGSIELSQQDLSGPGQGSPWNRGPGFHHVSFQVSSLNDILEEFSNNGYETIPHFPRDTPYGKIAFLNPDQTEGILMELKENK